MDKPLAGIRIADFSFHAACPFATHLLALMGAEVIKIESHLRLDTHRKPHPVYGRLEACSFHQVASNKLSVTLNLKDPRGIELAKRIVAISDMAAESMRPGVMERLGLGYEQLREIRPEIVMLSVSSSGQTGPDRSFAGYAPLFGAWGGLSYMTGYADGPPVEIRHVMDHSTGITATLGAIAALYYQMQTGKGQHVDLAAREVASAFIGEALVQAAAGDAPTRVGNLHPTMAPHGVYPCDAADTWVSIAVGREVEWRGLVAALGDASLANDPRFATAAARVEHRDALDAIVAAWTRSRSAGDAAETLQAHRVPATASFNAQALATDTHLRERGTVVDLPVGDRTYAVVGAPFRMSKSEVKLEFGTAAMGEHNDYVLGELLGIPEDERRELERERVIY